MSMILASIIPAFCNRYSPIPIPRVTKTAVKRSILPSKDFIPPHLDPVDYAEANFKFAGGLYLVADKGLEAALQKPLASAFIRLKVYFPIETSAARSSLREPSACAATTVVAAVPEGGVTVTLY
jgi:hypothetical protein